MLNAFYTGRLKADEKALMQRWYDSFGDNPEGVPGLEDEKAKQELEQQLDAGIRSALWSGRVEQSSKTSFAWRRIAAVITLTFATTGFAWWFAVKNPRKSIKNGEGAAVPTMLEVRTDTRQVKKLTLPDGSTVHINANSNLRIPQAFSDTVRQVYLDEGEAFFDVAKDDRRPFAVYTKRLQVQVLGTAFNVNAYAQLANISVAVQTGRIQLADHRGLLQVLNKDEAIRYRKEDGTIQKTSLNTFHASAWITGRQYLEKASFSELALAMHNMYGVTLKSEDPKTADDQYNLIIRADRRLEETMDLICAIHKNHYRRKGNDLIIYP